MSSLETASARSPQARDLVWGRESDKALAQRRKLSRDLHDSAIQPYIGLKLALEALGRKAEPENPLLTDIKRLVEMANVEIESLRRYVKRLREDRSPGRESLETALRRQTARFGQLYGIEVTVAIKGDCRVDPWLADELLHVAREGLSNIRRHTHALCALISLSRGERKIVLTIANLRDDSSIKPFTPESMSERARALGGTLRVETGLGRNTVVIVEIPLPA